MYFIIFWLKIQDFLFKISQSEQVIKLLLKRTAFILHKNVRGSDGPDVLG